ncbi:hypothetical protein F5Y16DRAFT_173742 [Xylariaceae sp. FL0255]|nr:hypothetical protein F5Y16DRAFT_173742 [Xylariaceae sp. FL0255]
MEPLRAVFLFAILTLCHLARPGLSTTPPDAYEIQNIAKRNPCDGINVTPQLNVTYGQTDCPMINQFGPNGDCTWVEEDPTNPNNCTFYCQVRTNFYPMAEEPIDFTYCRGPNRCWFPNGTHTGLSGFTYDDLSDQWRGALNAGITGGFRGVELNLSFPEGDVTIANGQCGYFTWIGTEKDVCGSMTVPTGYLDEDCSGPSNTTANYCVKDVLATPQGDPSAFGRSVFVYLDCDTRLPLSADQQDPIFQQYPDIAMDTNDLDSVLQDWVVAECTNTGDFLYNSFTIKGRGFKDSLLGSYGSGLLDALRHCGDDDPTQWKFEYTPTDGTYDWVASGIVSEFSTNCPGDAVLAIGGNNRAGC